MESLELLPEPRTWEAFDPRSTQRRMKLVRNWGGGKRGNYPMDWGHANAGRHAPDERWLTGSITGTTRRESNRGPGGRKMWIKKNGGSAIRLRLER